MRLPSAKDCVCSVVTVAQNGTPLTFGVSMSSKRMAITPPFGGSMPAVTGPRADSGPAWATMVATSIMVAIRATVLVFSNMTCFLQNRFSFHDPNAASYSVRANHDVRDYRAACCDRSRTRHNTRRRQLHADEFHHSAAAKFIAIHQAAKIR